MAKAEAHCKCQTCGRTFTVCKDCFNRTNANSFEEYAAANYTECPDCRKTRVASETESAAAKIIRENNLPEITGVSEKQIRYANNLRSQYLLSMQPIDIRKTNKYFERKDTPEFQQQVQAKADADHAGDANAALKEILEKSHIYISTQFWRESNVGKVIDILKDNPFCT